MPSLAVGEDRTNGLGDTTFTAFLSPAQPDGLIWGAGPVFQLPTDTNDLGNKNWGMGASAVVLKLEKGNPWVYGVLVNNVWSLSSDKRGGAYNAFLAQPFLNYNLPGGTYLTIVTRHHRQLEGGKRPALDGSSWLGDGAHLSFGQVAGQRAVRRLLQRRSSGQRGELAGAPAGPVDVSQVGGPSTNFQSTKFNLQVSYP